MNPSTVSSLMTELKASYNPIAPSEYSTNDGEIVQRGEGYVLIIGNVFQLLTYRNAKERKSTKKRKTCWTFSNASRRRLLFKVNALDLKKNSHWKFLTLTFPDETWPMTYRQRTNARNRMMQWLERKWQRPIASLWRQEWEFRKSGIYEGQPRPHYHILLYRMPFTPVIQITNEWQRCLNHTGSVSVDITTVRMVDGVVRYLCQYIAQTPNLDIVTYLNNPAMVGRAWGFTREALIPMGKHRVIHAISRDKVEKLHRMAETIMPNADLTYRTGFTLFGRRNIHTMRRMLLDQH